MNKEHLIAFEEMVAAKFNAAQIKAPIHLYSGNEDNIIDIFQRIKSSDWVFCSWRSHYQCLLKGVPEDLLMSEIMAGKSISLCFPDYKIYSSAIVGGILPIAVGTALSIKRSGKDQNVFCFLGDMTSETGIAYECIKYSTRFDLPIFFIIEDNDLSVLTDKKSVWNTEKLIYENSKNKKIIYYKYNNKYPHAGAGKRVQF